MCFYVITNAQGDYWSNEYGWTPHVSDADKFSDDERDDVCVPTSGKWVRYFAGY